MATNFKILIHRNSDSLHIKLSGDFDKNSAHELINFLRNHQAHASRVFIHTDALGEVQPLGEDVFQKNISSLKNHWGNLALTGDKIAL